MAVPLDELSEQVGRDIDAFDLICHVAFDQPPRTRRERADKVRKRNVFAKYGDKTRAVLEALLDKYADSGLKSVESLEILKVDPLTQFGTPLEIVHLFGGKRTTSPPSGTRNPALQESCLTMSNVSNIVKTIQDIMRKDAGTYGDAQRLEQLGWMFFLKIFDDREKEMELLRDGYKSPLTEALALVHLGDRRRRNHRRRPARLREQHAPAQAQSHLPAARTRSTASSAWSSRTPTTT